MTNLQAKFEVSTFTNYEDMKGKVKCKNWGGWVRDHPRSPAMSPFDRLHMTSYSTLAESMHLSCTVFKLQQVTSEKSRILMTVSEILPLFQ